MVISSSGQTADEPSHTPELRWPAFWGINVFYRNPVMRVVGRSARIGRK
ncbi:hypothetical protein [Gimesia sp.]